MILLVAQPCSNWETIAEVENKFNDTFGYNVLFSKRRQTINLPNGMNGCLHFRILWNIKMAVHLVSILNILPLPCFSISIGYNSGDNDPFNGFYVIVVRLFSILFTPNKFLHVDQLSESSKLSESSR